MGLDTCGTAPAKECRAAFLAVTTLGTLIAHRLIMVDSLETDETAPPAPPGGSKLPLIIMVSTALWVGAAVGMYMMNTSVHKAVAEVARPVAGAEGAASPAAHGEGGAAPAGGEGPVVVMSAFVVNLFDEAGGDAHYLRCNIAVELSGSDVEKTFETRTPKVRNSVLLYLSSLKLTQLLGSENKKKLLENLRDQISDVMGRTAVRDVYLTEFVIQ